MSKRKPVFRPPSLAQHFEAPDDHLGYFGWLCGYSADAGFLNDAAERFTRRTAAQRAHEGRVRLAVMLDPGQPQIQPTDVPGILHLPINAERPFRLLHAKVALLGSAPRRKPGGGRSGWSSRPETGRARPSKRVWISPGESTSQGQTSTSPTTTRCARPPPTWQPPGEC